ncbi:MULTISPECIES: rhomboid family intramembrane serine protease [unclassified Streptomyces]|uniref:rhomboid family intramembrane serine protease n=1 Tax=unclassified Streptomyces TaxID=2593676 RepID=UPI002250F336|nr:MULTISPECIES: rhomboid family intramembrane serine protease [unclassified Streptomyces]WSP60096.1 rhomboid family intramembrane serine protease [Streptomyces sp. NBC_01241]WSU23078.1 rhomboid family intramembrane serine protease [Streptomyces sp. NBC_01108]MCX4787933.1 rhomboid family intramembrane serine protease [Streptomyces sp. NBC_01221]MCX4796305.1 rhomboid family intramembrane serine protease [Streptomyces sp. NBC_01242]WSJ37546.1 rhomboid family intramembrane serine protease [Strept
MDQQPPGDQDRSAATDGSLSCYRHPGRGTHIRCTRCDRPICPECMVNASVGFQCPDCARQGAGTGHGPGAARPRTVAGAPITADPRLITKILLALNVAVFIVVYVKGSLLQDLTLLGRANFYYGGPPEGVAEGQWYRLVTSMFLHQEVWHIAFNMLGLWWLGGPLEAALGRARYLTLYLLSGLAGSALTYWLAAPNQPSLGASGAIFGLLGATAVLMRRLNYDMRPVFALLAVNLVITFNPWGGIAWQAHVGGLIAGTLIAIGMVHAPRERRALVQYGTCALVLATVVAIVVARTAALT